MRQPVRAAVISVVAIIVAHLLDGWAFVHLSRAGVYDHDLGRMLRTAGYLPVWWIIALGIGLQLQRKREALQLAIVPTVSGLLCEVLKMLLRRERPGLHAGHYYFRPFTNQPFYTRDIGLPSSHAMVAFAAAWVLCWLYPRGWPVWVGMAVACGITRVMATAHFLSDVTVGAVAAYFLVEIMMRRWEGAAAAPRVA